MWYVTDDEGHVLLYIDRSILNEYTSPQAFSGLRDRSRRVRHPATILLNVDHVNPTRPVRDAAMTDAGGQLQVDYFRKMRSTLASSCLTCSTRDRALNMWWRTSRGW